MEKTRKDRSTNRNGRDPQPSTSKNKEQGPKSKNFYNQVSRPTWNPPSRYQDQLQVPPYIPKPVLITNYVPKQFNYTYTGENYPGETTISPHGVITMRLRDHIRVDIALNGAVRVCNFLNGTIMAVNHDGSCSGLIHPNGRIFQYGSRVEILAYDAFQNNKYAKMWYKGVTFSSDSCPLVYLVDSAGTRTTKDTFSDLTGDFTLELLFMGSAYYYTQLPCSTDATRLINDATNYLQNSSYWVNQNVGTNCWFINNVRVSQTLDGLVRVNRDGNKYCLRTSPSNGTASITSPYMHCTGSLGQMRHLFVRRGERRMHFDGTTFVVRNAGHAAGFDEYNLLTVY